MKNHINVKTVGRISFNLGWINTFADKQGKGARNDPAPFMRNCCLTDHRYDLILFFNQFTNLLTYYQPKTKIMNLYLIV